MGRLLWQSTCSGLISSLTPLRLPADSSSEELIEKLTPRPRRFCCLFHLWAFSSFLLSSYLRLSDFCLRSLFFCASAELQKHVLTCSHQNKSFLPRCSNFTFFPASDQFLLCHIRGNDTRKGIENALCETCVFLCGCIISSRSCGWRCGWRLERSVWQRTAEHSEGERRPPWEGNQLTRFINRGRWRLVTILQIYLQMEWNQSERENGLLTGAARTERTMKTNSLTETRDYLLLFVDLKSRKMVQFCTIQGVSTNQLMHTYLLIN